ncbi:DUF975 family protein [Paenibacillus flagellatus]|uniref:DUF975 domain-containing protein n=1 Tax=Paenibacillus flagellatus TaxID=2211139 RepID=A0A2V5K3M7_9BACL|nr:DUF975 family protein [Paenibacillus flagellatus]PYI53875.1 hypothetical protein DLM86_15070 [Paenibacillus flagellatus]
MPTSSQLRAAARRSLSGNWGKGVGVSLLASIILGVVGAIPYIGWIGTLLLGGPISLGLYAFFLKLHRSERPTAGSLFDGFNRYGPSFLLYLLIYIFVLLWSLLLIVPGIIAALRYSQAYFVMQDNPGLTASEALNRSKEMMVGHKGRLFVLYLSFIGWAILAAIPFGLGYLWLAPYMMATQAAFYEDLKARTSGGGTYSV